MSKDKPRSLMEELADFGITQESAVSKGSVRAARLPGNK